MSFRSTERQTPSIVCFGQQPAHINQGVPIQKSRRVQLGHRAAIYCRVSTADQSCERQEFDLRAFAGRAGYDVVGIFKETGSGTKLARAERK
ncbi:TPA: recombinase family protein, partial [Klebsiella pneumoniae]